MAYLNLSQGYVDPDFEIPVGKMVSGQEPRKKQQVQLLLPFGKGLKGVKGVKG